MTNWITQKRGLLNVEQEKLYTTNKMKNKPAYV